MLSRENCPEKDGVHACVKAGRRTAGQKSEPSYELRSAVTGMERRHGRKANVEGHRDGNKTDGSGWKA